MRQFNFVKVVNVAYLLFDHFFVNISFAFSFSFHIYISCIYERLISRPVRGRVCLCGCQCRGRGPSGMQVFPLALFIFAFCIYNVCCCCCLVWVLLTCQHTQTQTNLWQRVSLFSWLAFFLSSWRSVVSLWYLWAVFTAALNINKYFKNLFIYLLNHFCVMTWDWHLIFWQFSCFGLAFKTDKRIKAFWRDYVFDLSKNSFEKQ